LPKISVGSNRGSPEVTRRRARDCLRAVAAPEGPLYGVESPGQTGGSRSTSGQPKVVGAELIANSTWNA